LLAGESAQIERSKRLKVYDPTSSEAPKAFGEVVTGDVTGPFATPSHLHGSKYLLAFIDTASGYIWDF
jgi:hypothetical protein